MGSDLPDPTGEMFSHELLTGMDEWHLQHPDATLSEIEHALDARWYRVRVRMLADLALQREAERWQTSAVADRPVCPDCGRSLIRRGC